MVGTCLDIYYIVGTRYRRGRLDVLDFFVGRTRTFFCHCPSRPGTCLVHCSSGAYPSFSFTTNPLQFFFSVLTCPPFLLKLFFHSDNENLHAGFHNTFQHAIINCCLNIIFIPIDADNLCTSRITFRISILSTTTFDGLSQPSRSRPH